MKENNEADKERASAGVVLERIVRQLFKDFLYYMTIFSFGYAGIIEALRGAELAPFGFILALIVLHSHFTSDQLIAAGKELEETQRCLIEKQRQVINSLS